MRVAGGSGPWRAASFMSPPAQAAPSLTQVLRPDLLNTPASQSPHTSNPLPRVYLSCVSEMAFLW